MNDLTPAQRWLLLHLTTALIELSLAFLAWYHTNHVTMQVLAGMGCLSLVLAVRRELELYHNPPTK